MAEFKLPFVPVNEEGWGPVGEPEIYKDVPYCPFSKSDRIGRVADWMGIVYMGRRPTDKYNSAFGSGYSSYAYYQDDEEAQFQLVDTTKPQKSIFERNRLRRQKYRNQRDRQNAAAAQPQQVMSRMQKRMELDRQRQFKKWQKQHGRNQDRNKQPQMRTRDPSVPVKKSWSVLDTWEFARLQKLSLTSQKIENLLTCGSVEYYDKTFDRITTSGPERSLRRIDRVFHRYGTVDDPIIRDFAKKETGNVYATDGVLAALMCALRSVYSWDIVVQKIKGMLFMDRRQDNTDFDLLTVNETAREPPPDEDPSSLNSARCLAIEASYINQNFSQQVLQQSGRKLEFERPNPFIDEEDNDKDIASVAYRYRMADLGNGVRLVYRAKHDAALARSGNDDRKAELMNIHALNEWDSKLAGSLDWRSRLESQRGAVIATELENNSSKLAKWTISSILAGSEQIKFGFVSRADPRDKYNHVILATQQFNPNEFASQINLNVANCWGILRFICDFCLKQPDGTFLIMKDPNKPALHMYRVPDDAFDSGSESESDESDLDDDDDDDAD